MSKAKYKPYPEYKNSGVEWLGEVPVGWEVFYGKQVFENRKEASLKNDKQLAASQKYGVIPQTEMMRLNDAKVMLALKGTSSFRHVSKDDFVISLRSFQGGIEYSAYSGCVSPAYTVLIDRKKIIPGFYRYLFKSENYISALQSATDSLRDGKSITYEQFSKIWIPYPQIAEQSQIAAFLDYKTVKIDNLIEKQKRLIELLKEKRQAVISHAVTKGLNPNVPMKDSGVEWLGEVPEHWVIASLKHLVSVPIIDGPHISPNRCDDGIPFISAEAISNGKIDFSKKWGFISEYENNLFSKRYSPRKGDILIVKLGATTGVAAIVDTDDDFNIWVPLAAVRMNNRMLPKYFLYLLQSVQIQDAIQLSWTFGTQQTLGLKTLSDLCIPIPSVKEQHVIVNFIEKDIPIIDNSIDNSFNLISLLQERRTALISAAVTGKIDVRDWKPPESQEDESNMPVEEVCSI